ncbi:hypothetical protein N7451_000890 [Penicillium sp. IBT 35674x]|nr:hypothetical protein N7451_000890 [Penicillium sp. IBT 35674x]
MNCDLYNVHEEGLWSKTGDRLTTDTRIALTGIAWSQGEIVGTVSVKKWDFGSPEGVVDDDLDTGCTECEGDFEVLIVAVKPGAKYRERAISESLLLACEEELKRNCGLNVDGSTRSLEIMLRVVREINGRYWSKKGFRVVGEKYYPPLTWDLERGFILWAMRRDLDIHQPLIE